jgi:hypothetical protein
MNSPILFEFYIHFFGKKNIQNGRLKKTEIFNFPNFFFFFPKILGIAHSAVLEAFLSSGQGVHEVSFGKVQNKNLASSVGQES